MNAIFINVLVFAVKEHMAFKENDPATFFYFRKFFETRSQLA